MRRHDGKSDQARSGAGFARAIALGAVACGVAVTTACGSGGADSSARADATAATAAAAPSTGTPSAGQEASGMPSDARAATEAASAQEDSSGRGESPGQARTSDQGAYGGSGGAAAVGQGSSGNDAAGGAPAGGCSTDGAQAIAHGASRIAPPLPDRAWVFTGETDYDTCADLSYAALDTQGATASSPMQLLLFHRGEFLGTGTSCNLAYQNIVGSSATGVDVLYRYLLGDDTSANPSGSFTVSYVWDGSRVVMNGEIPPEAADEQC